MSTAFSKNELSHAEGKRRTGGVREAPWERWIGDSARANRGRGQAQNRGAENENPRATGPGGSSTHARESTGYSRKQPNQDLPTDEAEREEKQTGGNEGIEGGPAFKFRTGGRRSGQRGRLGRARALIALGPSIYFGFSCEVRLRGGFFCLAVGREICKKSPARDQAAASGERSSWPKGNSDTGTSFICCTANGMPTMVIARRPAWIR